MGEVDFVRAEVAKGLERGHVHEETMTWMICLKGAMIGTFLVSFEGLCVAFGHQTLGLLASITCDYVSIKKIIILFFKLPFQNSN